MGQPAPSHAFYAVWNLVWAPAWEFVREFGVAVEVEDVIERIEGAGDATGGEIVDVEKRFERS